MKRLVDPGRQENSCTRKARGVHPTAKPLQDACDNGTNPRFLKPHPKRIVRDEQRNTWMKQQTCDRIWLAAINTETEAIETGFAERPDIRPRLQIRAKPAALEWMNGGSDAPWRGAMRARDKIRQWPCHDSLTKHLTLLSVAGTQEKDNPFLNQTTMSMAHNMLINVGCQNLLPDIG